MLELAGKMKKGLGIGRRKGGLSVIVTLHRVGSILQKCLDSLAAQVVDTDLEVILVEAGTTEKSAEIARSFAECTEGFSYVSLGSGGRGAARVAGLKASRGEYVAFLSTPDVVAPGHYQNLLTTARRTKAPLVLSQVVRHGHTKCAPIDVQRRAFRDLPMAPRLSSSPNLVFNQSLGSMLVRYDYLDECGLLSSEEWLADEEMACFVLMFNAPSMAHCPVLGYCQYSRNDLVGAGCADLDVFESRLRSVEACYLYALERGTDPGIMSSLDQKVLEVDLAAGLRAAAEWSDDDALSLMELADAFMHKWDPYDRLDFCSVAERQLVDCMERRDIAQLRDVVAFERSEYATATVKRSGRGYRIVLPRDLFTVERHGATHELRRYEPKSSISLLELSGGSLRIGGFSCKRRTVIRKGEQSLKAALVNMATGREIAVPIEPAPSKRAKTILGTVTSPDGREDVYNVGGAGFVADVPVEEVLADPKMRGLNLLRIEYANSLEKGFFYLKTASSRSRAEVEELRVETDEASLHIELGPLEQFRLVVE